jgi:hypothetical protein
MEMNVEKMYNDWCEQAKKERENIGKKILLGNFLLKDVIISEPIIKQQENDENSISLVLDYWIENEIQK